MSPLYIAAILITSAFIPPSLGQGYGPLPHKGKKHRTTTTTTLPPDIANLNLDGQQYQPGFINPISSTPVPDNSLGSYNPPGSSPQGEGPFWWQNPDSPFSGVSAPSPSQQPPAQQPLSPQGGCGVGAPGGCGSGSTPINIEGNPFLSGLRPGGAQPVAPSGQTVACSGAGYICAPKHLCINGVVNEDGQGLFQVRSEVQYCDAASQVCCRLPSGPSNPSGCSSYGSGGGCGGNLPAPGSPSQPGPGLVHVTPAPSQPGFIHVTPSPNHPPSGGNTNTGSGLVHVPSSPRPSFPTIGAQYPSPSIPSATYTPGNNIGRPVPGTNGVPIGGSIYDTTGRPVTPSSNQSPYTGPLNTTPHPGCAAALKCVQESYCTAEGVMADQPVTLTRDQYENRVPLSECADPDTGVIGKCCRDPNYKDPWPGGMMNNNGDGHQHQHQPDECGAGASCLQSYQCDNQYQIQPVKGCRVILDGASGVCCSNNQPSFPGRQPGGTFIPGTTPIPQKPVKKPIGYPQPKPGAQSFPQPVPSQSFPQPVPSQSFPQPSPSSPQPFPHAPSQSYPQSSPSPQLFPQPSQSSPQPFPNAPSQSFPQPSPSSPQPFPHVPSQSYPQPSSSPQPFPQPSPQPFPHVPSQSYPQPSSSSPRPFPQPSPSSPEPFPHIPSQSYPQPSSSSPQPFPQPSPQPFPHVPSQSYPQPSSSSPRPFPQPSPSSPEPFPHVPSQSYPQPSSSSPRPFPQPSPSSPQPFPHVPSQSYPQPSSSSPRPFPQPSPSSPQPFPYVPSQSYPQPSSSSPQPFPQPFPQSTGQPSHPVPSAQPTTTYPKPVKSVHPQPQSPFPQPQPTQPQPHFSQPGSQSQFPHPGSSQPQFPQSGSPQPFPQSHFPVPQPQPTQSQSQFPSRPSTGYSQPGAECGIRRQVSRQGLSDVDAGFSEFPWQALILSNSNHSALCSAAIISEKAVVTAAHCLHNLESSDIFVEVGTWRLLSNDQPKPVQQVQVAAIARHPNFEAGSLFNDLAVLILGKQLRFDDHIDKICLPPRGQDVTQLQRTCTATGWGKKALQGSIPGSILHQVSVRLIPHSDCENTLRQTHLGHYFILNPSFQCAVPTVPSPDLCKVDVGGPIACDRGDGHHELSGLYSWDIGCSPAVLGGIDIAWIENILSRPVDELVKDELNEILKQQQQQDLGNVDTENKPGFSQGYGKK